MSKLILIANRLPVTVEQKKNGEISHHPSVGGLATGMASLEKSHHCVWIGYSGLPSDAAGSDRDQQISHKLKSEYGYYTVSLKTSDIEHYYNGFSNQTIWPLFHYFQALTLFREESWQAYVDVNHRFYEVLERIYSPGDMIWIHDYHLMLLPGIIREKLPEARIGFFLHIPFPSYELFRLLPWRKEILSGILGADLIGFHTYGYVRHFLNSVQRLLGIENSMGLIKNEGRSIRSDIFPLGIDYTRYSEYMKKRKIVREIETFQKTLEGKRMILSMDRLDFTKGINERLYAYERFLKKYPEYHGKVSMVLVTVPSRTEVETYISLRKRVNEQVGRINGKYNTLHWSPIQYLYRSLPFEMIMTLYHCADVCLVTPLRDGMNLIAKEYIASRTRGDGMLILSEMAGASEELGESLVVNPNNREEVADAIAAALSMSTEEQKQKIMSMQLRLKRNDVYKWADSFMEKLAAPRQEEEKTGCQMIGKAEIDEMTQSSASASCRLFLLDYDGTLVRFENRPERAVPDKALIDTMRRLSEKPGCEVMIISGRPRSFCDCHFGGLNIIIAAEHGGWFKLPGHEWQSMTLTDTDWKTEVRQILELYCDRTPGTFLEEKDFSLAWHYRSADRDLAAMRAMELKGNLLNMVANHNLGILEGNRVLEVIRLEVSKGKAASYLLASRKYDFILAMGDDATDEDLFTALPGNAYTVKVGRDPSRARFCVPGVEAARSLLKKFAEG